MDSNAVVRVLSLTIILVVLSMSQPVFSQSENAEVSRRSNVQYFEMTPPVHPPGNSSVSRLENLQFFEMIPPVHPAGNSSVVRTGNLQLFALTPTVHPPGNAYTIRTGNVQYFEMAPLLYEFKINITSLVTTDQNNNPTSNFLRGAIVQLNFTIRNLGGTESLPLSKGLISTVVIDPTNTTVSLTYTYEDLPRGASRESIVGWRISTTGATGAYSVKITIFTDWPSRGGIMLDVETKTFTVN